MDNPGQVVAVVPLKALDAAKQRLATALDPVRRRDVAAWMFGRVVEACVAAESVDRLLAVVGDAEGAALAARHGIAVLVEPAPGLSRAIGAADAALGPTTASLVVAADLPLASGADLDAVCAAGASGPVVVVAPTRDGGTGALLRRPPHVIPPAFGPGSATRHLEAATRAGARAVRVDRAGLALDVDDAEGLRLAENRLPALAAVTGR